jgi:hypothetical protein
MKEKIGFQELVLKVESVFDAKSKKRVVCWRSITNYLKLKGEGIP